MYRRQTPRRRLAAGGILACATVATDSALPAAVVSPWIWRRIPRPACEERSARTDSPAGWSAPESNAAHRLPFNIDYLQIEKRLDSGSRVHEAVSLRV